MYNDIPLQPSTYTAMDSLPGYYTAGGFLTQSDPTIHRFSSNGFYTLYIYGGNITGAYSYVPAYNRKLAFR